MVISSKMKGRSLRRSRNLHYRQTISKYFNVIKQKTDLCSDVLFDLIFNPNSCWIVAPILLIVEVFINILIIEKAKYTEIDWRAYMQEVGGVLNERQLDYQFLKGDTGPLVYPAGFVYIFSGLYRLTSGGSNIRLAQYIFAMLYVATLGLVFRLYVKSKKVPPYMLVLACLCSYRIHSIYALRLFNDPVAMLFLYAALNCYIDQAWTLGSVFFSLGVSIKMNVLLYAPAVLCMFLYSLGVWGTLLQLVVCASLQIILGLPFLLTNWQSYMLGSFNLGRVFLYEWTVNWKFLPEHVFLDRRFHVALLVLHILLLGLFAVYHWSRCLRAFGLLSSRCSMPASCQLLLLPLFLCNLIGVACSRSLHYQFYVWYFHSLPYLVCCTGLPTVLRLLVLGCVELCWNVFPATALSSAVLQCCHAALILSLFKARPSDERVKELSQKISVREEQASENIGKKVR